MRARAVSPTKIEMSLVDGEIVQVTRMDGEEMEVESSSRQVQKQRTCEIHRIMLRFEGQRRLIRAAERSDMRPGTLDNV